MTAGAKCSSGLVSPALHGIKEENKRWKDAGSLKKQGRTTSKDLMTPNQLWLAAIVSYFTLTGLHTHTSAISQLQSLHLLDETLMIMMMSNDNHFTTLTLAGSHFPPCGSRALSYECSRCGPIKEKLQSDEECTESWWKYCSVDRRMAATL